MAVLIVTVTFTALFSPPGGWLVPTVSDYKEGIRTRAAAVYQTAFRSFIIFNDMALSTSLASLATLIVWQMKILAQKFPNVVDAHELVLSLKFSQLLEISKHYVILAVALLFGSIFFVLAAGIAASFVLQSYSGWAEAAGIVLALVGPVGAVSAVVIWRLIPSQAPPSQRNAQAPPSQRNAQAPPQGAGFFPVYQAKRPRVATTLAPDRPQSPPTEEAEGVLKVQASDRTPCPPSPTQSKVGLYHMTCN